MSEVYPGSKRSIRYRDNLKTLTNQGTHQIMLGFQGNSMLVHYRKPQRINQDTFLKDEVMLPYIER